MPADSPDPALAVERTPLEGLLVLRPRSFRDSRGSFFEAWHRPRYEQRGLAADFVQDNVVVSAHGVLRGLHYQQPAAQTKLVSVLDGEVFDVVVDIRARSATFRQWYALRLSAENRTQLWIPPGFAHGYQVLSPSALLSYKCSHVYDPACDRTILWSDPAIGIRWPAGSPVLSPKDERASPLAAVPPEHLF